MGEAEARLFAQEGAKVVVALYFRRLVHRRALLQIVARERAGFGRSKEFYDSKVKVLSEQIEHHVGEEERPADGIFSQARAAGLDMNDLGNRMRARKQELMARYKSEGFDRATRLPAPR
jgi:hypothetical protein